MSAEILNIYDCFNHKVGTEERKVIHANGLWHRAICFLVIDPDTREIVFQDSDGLSAYDQEGFFLKLNGGHLAQDDSLAESFRELKEELGLVIKPEDSLSVGTYQLSVQFSETFKNNEFISFFIIPVKDVFSKIKFEDGEVASIIRFNIDDAIEMLLGNKDTVKAVARDDKDHKEVLLKKENLKDFTDDNLYLRLLISTKRYLDGERKELILV